ncbi:MAG: ATP-binding cassette domain-containing protein [Deltaproteobacteria bacterium]|nr:MAG: ATP-binding cassette domain-containing protein [Deltaproteobacteria bacterium]
MPPPIIALANLRKRFGSTVALDGIDLTIARPCIFGVVGPDGAGKTTLLRILVGLLEFDATTATVLGYALASHRLPGADDQSPPRLCPAGVQSLPRSQRPAQPGVLRRGARATTRGLSPAGRGTPGDCAIGQVYHLSRRVPLRRYEAEASAHLRAPPPTAGVDPGRTEQRGRRHRSQRSVDDPTTTAPCHYRYVHWLPGRGRALRCTGLPVQGSDTSAGNPRRGESAFSLAGLPLAWGPEPRVPGGSPAHAVGKARPRGGRDRDRADRPMGTE